MIYFKNVEELNNLAKEYIFFEIQKTTPDIRINLDTELLDSRIISSIKLIHILSGLEDKFGVDMLAVDFKVKDFKTIGGILNIVCQSYNIQKFIIEEDEND